MSKVHLIQKQGPSDQLELSQSADKEVFSELFQIGCYQDGSSMKKLIAMGGEQGIAGWLNVTLETGAKTEDIQSLRERFGSNDPVPKPLTPIWKFIVECLSDTMIQILCVAAVVATIIGMLQEGVDKGWYEGVTIFFAVFLITFITTGNNYVKERQFQKLQSKLDQQIVTVLRDGKPTSIDSKDLVVGDVLLFNLGDIFAVDGVIISGSEVRVDESSVTGESDEIKKIPLDELRGHRKPDESAEHNETANSLLISGTKVVDGSGQMLVMTVGEQTCQGQMRKLLENENAPTPLMKKLESVANDIGALGTIVAIITFVVLLIRYYIKVYQGDIDTGYFSVEALQFIVNSFMIGITIIVVAVPEGLPLSVTITLAFAVGRMKDEQNLVKTLASCETMGGANNICTDKTGTLTMNKMIVTEVFLENQELKNLDQQPRTARLFSRAVCYNSSAFPKKNPSNGTFIQTGNKTECALIQLADQWGYPVSDFRPSKDILKVIPFNSSRKKMFTCVYQEDSKGLFVYVKGASEIVLSHCTKIIDRDGKARPLEQAESDNIVKNIIEKYATQSLRTVALAYKEIEGIKFDSEDPRVSYKEWLGKCTEEYLEKDLTFIGIAGIRDPIRPEVPDAIRQCNRSGITVRMVTGDNLLTAKAYAQEIGIVHRQGQQGQYEIMEGKEFRTLVGGLKTTKSKDGKDIFTVKDLYRFQMIAKELRVLARASPEDKFTLVTGLMELDNVVAVTGDGTNDAPALRKADVGFAMGIAGSDVSKEAADIILLDDNFKSIITACKWGRNVYNCIRKFIQFQLTVNVVALFMSVLGAVVLTQSPLNSIQMLWVNLIMDTFASIALATEPPSDEVLNKPPYGKKENIVNATMYRTIFGQSIYQIIVLTFILFKADLLFDISFPAGLDSEIYPQNIVLLSFFFQAFVIMQVFNAISCRKLEEKSLNPFSNLFNNIYFWIIQLITIGVQFLMIEFGGKFVVVIPLTWQQNLMTFGFGLGGLIVGIFVRFIPSRIFRKIQFFKEIEVEEENMDATITSKLRRKGSVRMGGSMVGSQVDPATGQRVARSVARSLGRQNSFSGTTSQRKPSNQLRRSETANV